MKAKNKTFLIVLFGKLPETQRTQNKQRIKGEFNWKFLYLVCAFATDKDAFQDFLDALFRKRKVQALADAEDLEISGFD
ncbi:MAG TPA: hypothetical protein VF599_23740 [Pyrinomonadaceae bacterium]|jgi:hypothetical protein